MLGKQANCQVAVTLSVANQAASLPIAHRLYLPEAWVINHKGREKTGVPAEIGLETKHEIALAQVRQALADGVPPGIVLADAAYGNHLEFRHALNELQLTYCVGINENTSVWPEGRGPLPAPTGSTGGRPARYLRRDADHKPLSVKELATSAGLECFKTVVWREGSNRKMSSRFLARRVRPARGDRSRTEPHPEEWLLVEWPKGAPGAGSTTTPRS